MSKQVTTWAALSDAPNLDAGINKGEMSNPAKASEAHPYVRTFVNDKTAPQRAYGGNAASQSSNPSPSAGRTGAHVDFNGAFENGRAMIHSEFTPKTVIKVDGMEVSLAVAERLGVVRRGPNGYEATTAANGATAQQRQQGASGGRQTDPRDAPPAQQQGRETAQQDEEAPKGETVSFSKDLGEALNAAHAAAPDAFDAVSRDAMREDFDPSNSQSVNALASRLGIEPAQAAKMTADTVAAFRATAERSIVSALGEDLAASFSEWAVGREDVRAADVALGKTGRADYSAPIKAFLADLGKTQPDHALGMAREAGLTARKVTGEVVVDVPGVGQMGWAVAVRGGFLPFRVA